MYKDYLEKGFISSINNLVEDKQGIIFFISTENYIKYLEFLLASLRINASNWIYLSIQIGDFKTSYDKSSNLIKYYINFPEQFDTKKKKKAFSANLRIPIINQLVKNINTNKLIYTDIDNLFMNEINDLFKYYPTKKIILKKIKKNFIDQILKTKDLMFYKSGVIILYTNNYKYLRDDIIIKKFSERYLSYSKNNMHNWFTDQVGLSKIYQNSDIFNRYTFFSDKICDWELYPLSYIWAAKGYIKETLIWKNISLFLAYIDCKISEISIIRIKKRIRIAQIIIFFFKLLIFPIVFLRIKCINFIFRILRFFYKKLLLLIGEVTGIFLSKKIKSKEEDKL